MTGKGRDMAITARNRFSVCCKAGWLSLGLAALAGCEDANGFNPFKSAPGAASDADASGENGDAVTLVERDVEAPDVFQVTDMGLWDGRPSLGGVWVAHPDVGEPERVIIRNMSNSKFVIGALFRRERENPGPVLQVSSDAADALGMLAGSPAQLNVTALRREQAEPPAPEDEAHVSAIAEAQEVETAELDPIAGAAAAIETAEAEAEADAGQAQQTDAAPAGPVQDSSLDKPFIQIGIFSVEQNARDTATAMRQSGMVPTVKEHNSQGKTFWRVVVGPASNRTERGTLLTKIKGIGFEDAYPVSN